MSGEPSIRRSIGIQTRSAWHIQIEQDQINMLTTNQIKRFIAGSRLQYRISVRGQRCAQNSPDLRFVVNDQHYCGNHGCTERV